MYKFIVKFYVDGKIGGEIVVEARDSTSAKRIALGELQGRIGYAGKRITLGSVSKVR